MCDEIIYPFTNVNGATADVWGWVISTPILLVLALLLYVGLNKSILEGALDISDCPLSERLVLAMGTWANTYIDL